MAAKEDLPVGNRPIWAVPIIYPLVPKEIKEPVAPLFREWAEIVAEYEANPDDLFHAWLYLGQHPAFWDIREGTDVEYYLVPGGAWYQFIELGVEKEGKANTVWLEISPSVWPGDPSEEEVHAAAPGVPDRHLNIKGTTYEQAVVTAAKVVHSQYGNDREFLKIPQLEEGKWWG